jgi:hypothetical protein
MPVTPHEPGLGLASENLLEVRGTMFSRTQNENGTYNARCLYCFMTIVSAVESPEELDRIETRHICPEKALADLMARRVDSPPLVQLH